MDERPRLGPGGEDDAGGAITGAMPPLAVGGLVLTRAALVAALRFYVSQVADVSVLDDGRFLLHLAEDAQPA